MGKTSFAAAGQTRKETPQFRVLVTPAERAAIRANADACGLPVSKFLRALGLGYAPAAKLDAAAVKDLLRVSGDLGRLGGLLKMYLTDRDKFNTTQVISVARLLEQIEATHRRVRDAANDALADMERQNR
jgi:hypothetical protein